MRTVVLALSLLCLLAAPAGAEQVEAQDSILTPDGLLIPAGAPGDYLGLDGGMPLVRFVWGLGADGARVDDPARTTLRLPYEILRWHRPGTVTAPVTPGAAPATAPAERRGLLDGGPWRR